jgi:hypothetical protein
VSHLTLARGGVKLQVTRCSAKAFGREPKQQPKGVPITGNGMWTCTELSEQPFGEEPVVMPGGLRSSCDTSLALVDEALSGELQEFRDSLEVRVAIRWPSSMRNTG